MRMRSVLQVLAATAAVGLAGAAQAAESQVATGRTRAVVVPADEALARHGVERRDRDRVAAEHAGPSRPAEAAVQSARVDRERPTTDVSAQRRGAGMFGPDHAAGILALWTLILRWWRGEE